MSYATTPIYHMKKPTGMTTALELPDVLGQMVDTVETALAAGGVVPPGAADLVALSGRVSTLEADTGWVVMTPQNGATHGSGQIRYRVLRKVCYLNIQATLPAPFTANTAMATLPVGARPDQNIYQPAVLYGGTLLGGQILSTGVISLAATTSAGGALFAASFPVA